MTDATPWPKNIYANNEEERAQARDAPAPTREGAPMTDAVFRTEIDPNVHDEARRGDWLQTFTGRQFWPLDPRPSEVFVEDIAHALAQLCRYGGHCQVFYSVAQHSVYVSEVVPPELAFVGLMHDAAEAYLIDLPRPIKKHIYEYRLLEERVEAAIAERFGFALPDLNSTAVKQADNAVMLAEKLQIMKPQPAEWAPTGVEPANVNITYWSPYMAEHHFLQRFYELADAAR